MSELNPSEAQRKAMAQRLRECGEYGVFRTVDEMIAAANKASEGAPVGTIARRPDGAVYAVRSLTNHRNPYWTYVYVDLGNDEPFSEQGDAADSWPQVRPDEWPVSKVYSTEEAAEILGVDLTAQQEPVLRERFPEQASAYVADPELAGVDDEPLPSGSLITPKPRVLPSLDCEEARDGTAWQAAFSNTVHRRGWKFWYVPAEREWHTDGGYDGSGPLNTLDFLTERGPYTEVLGDPS